MSAKSRPFVTHFSVKHGYRHASSTFQFSNGSKYVRLRCANGPMKRRSELSKRSLIMSLSVVATIQKSRQFALGPMSSTCQSQSVRLLEKINNGTDVYSGNLGNVRLDFIITNITDVTRCASAATSDVIFILCFQFMFTDVSVLQAMYCDQAQMNAFPSPSAMLYRPGSVNA